MNDNAVDAYFDKQEGEVAEIALALRSFVCELGTELTCKLAWGFPCWSGNERLFSIIAHKDRCNFQLYYGNQLAERWPERVEGTGKQMRHVKVRSRKDIDDELSEIVLFSIQLDKDNPVKIR